MLGSPAPPDPVRLMLRFGRVPFRVGGTCLGGADCRGLALMVIGHGLGRRLAEPPPAYATVAPGAEPHRAHYREALPRWRKLEQLRPWAMMLFRVGEVPAHCGVWLGDGLMIHTRAGAGVRISNIAEPEGGEPAWAKRLLASYWPREADHEEQHDAEDPQAHLR